MAKLSDADAEFLLGHDIPLSTAFDASGMPAREWKAAMKAEGKFVAYGVTCLRGHSLKTRSGNCIRCNTANIAFARRAAKEGFVYLARSAKLGLIKVGFSEDPANRIYIANLEGYAGADDWQIHECDYSESAGRVEIAVHSILKNHIAPQMWERDWIKREAREIYSCTLVQARHALTLAASGTLRLRGHYTKFGSAEPQLTASFFAILCQFILGRNRGNKKEGGCYDTHRLRHARRPSSLFSSFF